MNLLIVNQFVDLQLHILYYATNQSNIRKLLLKYQNIEQNQLILTEYSKAPFSMNDTLKYYDTVGIWWYFEVPGSVRDKINSYTFY